MSFTQRQKALNMLREIRERGGPEIRGLGTAPLTTFRPRSTPVPQEKTATPERLNQAVSNLFTRLKNQETDADTAEQLVDECIELFEKDKKRVEKVCAGHHELADVAAAWTRHNRIIAEVLDESLFIFFEGRELNALSQNFLRIKAVLQERLSCYPRLYRASAPEEQVA